MYAESKMEHSPGTFSCFGMWSEEARRIKIKLSKIANKFNNNSNIIKTNSILICINKINGLILSLKTISGFHLKLLN